MRGLAAFIPSARPPSDCLVPPVCAMRVVDRRPLASRGAALLAVIIFIMVGTFAVTAFIHLLGARLQQVERMGIGVKRHVVWGNTEAVNQQYAYTWTLRDNVTRTASTATLAAGTVPAYADALTWGGVNADAFTSFSPYRTTQRASTATISYPFNNLRVPPTTDSSVFYLRTLAEGDDSQIEHLSIYNYQKSYPAPLLGDLLIVHKKAAGATGTYDLDSNFRVDGRVVIYDGTAVTANVRATACMQAVAASTNTTKTNDGSATLLPENYPARPTATAGYGGTSVPTAVTNGTLKLINNTDFTAGSIRHTLEAGGTSTWMTCSTSSASSTNVETDGTSGSSTSDTQVKQESSVTYALPTTSPYGYSKSGNLNVLIVRLKNSTLKHLRVTSGVEQLVLEGQTSTTDFNNAGNLAPVIIWVEQNDLRDIRFVGENNRPLILATGPGTGATIYMGFHGTSLVTNGPLRWHLQLISEYRPLYFNCPSSSINVELTGSIRTDWILNCTDTGSTARIFLVRDASPGNLVTMLPRDAWVEPYVLVR